MKCNNGRCDRPGTGGTGGTGNTSGCALEPVYFDFNENVLSTEATAAIDRNADCLKQGGKGGSVSLTGHSDPRGTEEYNLALSDRRAQAVRDRLTRMGFTNGVMRLVPKGELEYELELLPPAGQSLRVDGSVGTLSFGTHADEASAFVRLGLQHAVGTLGLETLDRARLKDGRVVVVGDRPLLDAVLDPDRGVVLYAQPGLRYRIEQSHAFDGSAIWLEWLPVTPTRLDTRLPAPADTTVFLRAVRLP